MIPTDLRRGRRARKADRLPGISDPTLLAAYAAAQPWLRRSYVTGIGIGYARENGQPTNEIAVSVHVARRVPEAGLTKSQRFPRTILGVRVDVVESNMAFHLSESEVEVRRRQASNPLRPGVLIRTSAGDLGTVGLLVRSKGSGETFILGSGHVMVASGMQFFQPHGGAAGKLQGAVTQVERSRGDAGIASYSGRIADNRPLGTNIRITTVRDVRPFESLIMSGAFSGITYGVVDWIGQKSITYGNGEFANVPGFQLRRPSGTNGDLSQPGDSGALWFDSTDSAVGISVGGGDDVDPWAFACHIVDVMECLGVML